MTAAPAGFLRRLLPVVLMGLAATGGCDDDEVLTPAGEDWIQLAPGTDVSVLYEDRVAPARVDFAWISLDTLYVNLADINCREFASVLGPTRFPEGDVGFPVYFPWKLATRPCLTVVIPGTLAFYVRPVADLHDARFGTGASFHLDFIYRSYGGAVETTLVPYPR